MPDFLTSALAFVGAIALLVAVHEFGHFSVARALGVKVIRFSLGFGRVIWSSRHGPDDTEYCVSAIPLGGYVKLLDERDCAVSVAERGRAFNLQPVSARIAILAAGPALNLAFAVVAYWLLFVTGVPGIKPVIGTVTPSSVAEAAGLRPQDTITAVGGSPVYTWEAATLALLDGMLADGEIRLTVAAQSGDERAVILPTAGREGELTEPGQLFRGLGMEPYLPRLQAIIGEVTADSPADRAGLRSGDLVLTAAGKDIADWEDWVGFVRARPGETIDVSVQRGDSKTSLEVAIGSATDGSETIGRIGAAVSYPQATITSLRAEERYGPWDALPKAVDRTWNMSLLTVRMIWRMVAGDVSVKNISGPINIAQYAGQSAAIGLAAFLSFLAIVSISLGVLNLLPVPLLDGGQIVYTLAEAVKGSPLSERAQLIGQQVGIFFLLVLMSFAFYNDISRLLG